MSSKILRVYGIDLCARIEVNVVTASKVVAKKTSNGC
jgi:hypothetical protein